MRQSLTSYFQDEARQRLATDINELVREIVQEVDAPRLYRDLKVRMVTVKLGHIKLRLAKLKQSLQHHLEQLEDRLRHSSSDEEIRYYVALVTEHLADLWLMESLLDRVTKTSERTVPSSKLSFERTSTHSTESEEAGEAV